MSDRQSGKSLVVTLHPIALMHPILSILVRALALSSTLSVAPCAEASVRPQPAGALAEDANQPEGIDLSEALDKLRAKTDVPGAVMMVMESGEVVLWGAAGVRALGSDDPIQIGDPMHLGSCTKAMTSTLVGLLVEDGVLRWDTTISQALPEFAKKIDPGYHDITIELLVKHQAGIAERRRPEVAAHHGALQTVEGTPVEARLQILAGVLAIPPSPSVAGTYDYSNFGYMLAGSMLEGITGKSWGDLMMERLFKPLKMKSAGIGSPAGAGVPVGHNMIDGTLTALPPGPGGALAECMGPAGLAHCTLADWGIFINQHLNGAGGIYGFIKPNTLSLLHKDHGGSKYAAGWLLQTRRWGGEEAASINHNGSDGSWLSETTAIPELDLTIMVAFNSATTQSKSLMQDVMNLLLTETGFMD
ncbi:MAG: D-alanyl-D-alanine carboxypeptidase [Planctomycetota bacterium]|jgi:D-alanyl-D-alanine carboxypeptidase